MMKSFYTFSAVFLFFLFFLPFYIAAQNCNLDYSFSNTGSNMIIMINDDALINDVLVIGDSLGAFIEIEDEFICVGAIEWTGLQQTLAVWGNDPNSSSQNGLMLLEEIVLKAESNGVFYDVAYSPVFTYQVNGIEILNTSLSFTPYCNNLGNVYGCTNENYLEYNPLANIYDGSCATIVVYGCTDILYIEYSITANC